MFVRIVTVLCAGGLIVAAPTAVASGVAVPAGSAPRAGAAVSRTHCAEAEQIVYSCAMGRKIVSICAAGETLSYRYGPLRKPEIAITSDGRDGRVHQGFIVGGGPVGQQSSIRFSNNSHDYIVYSAIAGEYTEIAGTRWSGLVVRQGEDVLRETACRSNGTHQEIQLGDLPATIAQEKEEDLGWF